MHPFAAGLLAALDAARSGFDSEHLLALAKNCVTGIGPAEAGELENYCFVWGVSGAAWRADFTNNPDGMSEGFTEEQAERLGRINETRRKLAGPLVTLRRELADCDGRGFAAAAFGWLERVKAAEHLQEAAAGMEEGEQKRFLEMSAQVWEALLGLLDVFGGALADVRLPLGRLIDLLRMGISAADIGLIPQTIDQVIVGAADPHPAGQSARRLCDRLQRGGLPALGDVGGHLFRRRARPAQGARGRPAAHAGTDGALRAVLCLFRAHAGVRAAVRQLAAAGYGGGGARPFVRA